jgi:hypothetical protein
MLQGCGDVMTRVKKGLSVGESHKGRDREAFSRVPQMGQCSAQAESPAKRDTWIRNNSAIMCRGRKMNPVTI